MDSLRPVEVTKIDLSSDKLSITGMRLIEVYDSPHHQFILDGYKHAAKVKIEIELRAPLNTLQDAIATIGQVFTSNLDDLVPSLPDYWRTYLQRQQKTTSAETVSSGPRSNANAPAQKDAQVARVGDKGVKPPKALFTPEPKYPLLARAASIQGACIFSATIGVDGAVHDLHLLQPRGAGLDEAALSVMRTWKFKPATQNGQPVPVRLSLEVSFNLYK
ncbi:MAG TPA: energy transducer TonB [Candidatus Angelobacter sp.]|nr:energy transducer TonB [Candidatus Angelobacter sp.]